MFFSTTCRHMIVSIKNMYRSWWNRKILSSLPPRHSKITTIYKTTIKEKNQKTSIKDLQLKGTTGEWVGEWRLVFPRLIPPGGQLTDGRIIIAIELLPRNE